MEKDDEVKGKGNSYTSYWRSYDPRLGRWKSLDPEIANLPHQSPYVGFDNNPVSFSDPFGNCTKCPKDKNFEGRKYTTDEGDSYVYSNGNWTPGGEYSNWEAAVKNGKTNVGYFDFYAGVHGFDPTRDDWDMESFPYQYSPEKASRMLAFQTLYNNDAVDSFLKQYSYGGGNTMTVSLEDFKKGVGVRQKLGVTSFPAGRDAIKKFMKNPTKPISIDIKTKVYAVHAGTLGNYTVIISGKLSEISKGSKIWKFDGELSIIDTYDFDASTHRPANDEWTVMIARQNLFGKPFKVRGTYPVHQNQFDSYLDIYKGMDRKNIISNYHKLKKNKTINNLIDKIKQF